MNEMVPLFTTRGFELAFRDKLLLMSSNSRVEAFDL